MIDDAPDRRMARSITRRTEITPNSQIATRCAPPRCPLIDACRSTHGSIRPDRVPLDIAVRGAHLRAAVLRGRWSIPNTRACGPSEQRRRPAADRVAYAAARCRRQPVRRETSSSGRSSPIGSWAVPQLPEAARVASSSSRPRHGQPVPPPVPSRDAPPPTPCLRIRLAATGRLRSLHHRSAPPRRALPREGAPKTAPHQAWLPQVRTSASMPAGPSKSV